MYEIIPGVRPDATPDEVRGQLSKLAGVLDSLLMGGLDSKNVSRGGVSLGNGSGLAGNLNARFVTYVSNATPNTQDTVTHSLGRVPVGYIVVSKDKAGDIYDSSKASWTTTSILLKCSVASVTSVLLVF